MPKILPDDEIAEGVNSLNLKQRKVFNYVKYNGDDVKPVHIFVSGSGETGKSHLVKVIYITQYQKYCFIIVSFTWSYRNINSKYR